MSHSYVTSYNKLEEIEEFELNNINMKETALKYKDLLNVNS